MPKTVEIEIDRVIRKALEIAATPPQNRTEIPLPRSTLKRLVVWVKENFQIDCCRDTVRKLLKRQASVRKFELLIYSTGYRY